MKKPPQQKKPKKAYSFIRFSSKKQELGDSLRRQTEATEKYAQEKNLVLDEHTRLTALGVSGFSGKHIAKGSALGGFLQAVKKGEIKAGTVLIIESLDRLSRLEVLDAFEIFANILRAGIEIHTLQDRQVYTKKSISENMGQIFVSIGILFGAHDESKRKSKRLSSVWGSKKKNAASEIVTSRLPAWLEIQNGKIVEIPARVKIVQEIFRLKLEGKGKRVIANILNARNVQPFGKGKEFQSSYVHKILRNRAVLGEFQGHIKKDGKRIADKDAPIVPDYYPQIICFETWNKAKESLNAGRIAGSTGKHSGSTTTNLFNGLCRSVKGHKLCFENKGRNTTWQYLNDRKGTSVNYWEFLTRFMPALRSVDWESVMQEGNRKGEEINREVEVLQKELDGINKQAKSIVALIEADVDMEEIKTKGKQLKRERERIEKELGKLLKGKGTVVDLTALSTDREWLEQAQESMVHVKLAIHKALKGILVYDLDRFDLEFRTGRIESVQYTIDAGGLRRRTITVKPST
jgi:DNA invertase Pin-like site-specific DNA recombinase